ncbi:MAG: hypothetical protein CMM01_21725 [Rhodopirellula sp.]|nr:hypothetical protein [Rhodopirellula sp.]
MQEMSGSALWFEACQGRRQTTSFSGCRTARGWVGHALMGYLHDTRYCNLVGRQTGIEQLSSRDAGGVDHRIDLLFEPKACHATLQQRLS